MESHQATAASPKKKILAVLLVLAGIGLAVYRSSAFLPSALARENPAVPGGTGLAGAPRPQEMFCRMESELGLTDEQKRQLMDLRRELGPPDPRNMAKVRERMAKILTPEQQTQMRQKMRSFAQQRVDREKSLLPADQAEKLQKKFDERMDQMDRGFGPQGGPF